MQLFTFAIVDDAGAILSLYRGPYGEELDRNVPEGARAVRADHVPATACQAWHAVGDEVVPRPAMAFDRTTIVADGTDAATLTLDRPFTITVEGTPHSVEEAPFTATLRASMPTTYRVRVECFPYLDLEAEIVAHAP